MPARPFVHGYEIYFEKATLSYESGTCPLTVYHQDGRVTQPELFGAGDPITAFARELQSAIDGCVRNQGPALLSAQLARDALVMCEKECASVITGQMQTIA